MTHNLKGQQLVAGLWCEQVLERLSDYIDNTLSAIERQQLEQHVAACDMCARFGASVAAVKLALSQTHNSMPQDVEQRLLKNLGLLP